MCIYIYISNDCSVRITIQLFTLNTGRLNSREVIYGRDPSPLNQNSGDAQWRRQDFLSGYIGKAEA